MELTGSGDSGDAHHSGSGSSNGSGGGITTTALLSVKPLNGPSNISRNNSFNVSLNLQDPNFQRSSVRSAGPTDSVDSSAATMTQSRGGKDATSMTGGGTATASSAPSTLAKHKPEQKTGEVYV